MLQLFLNNTYTHCQPTPAVYMLGLKRDEVGGRHPFSDPVRERKGEIQQDDPFWKRIINPLLYTRSFLSSPLVRHTPFDPYIPCPRKHRSLQERRSRHGKLLTLGPPVSNKRG